MQILENMTDEEGVEMMKRLFNPLRGLHVGFREKDRGKVRQVAKEKQDQMAEEVQWCLAGSSTVSSSWPFDDNRIQEANRALEAFASASQRD